MRATRETATYASVRSLTEVLAAPLSPEDQTVQSMPDVSPTKWHRAHVTWFFETFVLQPHLPRYRPSRYLRFTSRGPGLREAPGVRIA